MNGQESKKKILVIDDDARVGADAKAILESAGYAVTLVNDGEVALEMLHHKDEIPNLILLDIIMPKIDGYTIVKKIKHHVKTRHIPIIIFSERDGMKELFAVEGITDYLVKPVDKEELLGLVKKRI